MTEHPWSDLPSRRNGAAVDTAGSIGSPPTSDTLSSDGGEQPEQWPDLDSSILDIEVIAAPPFPKVLPAGWDGWTRDAAESAGCPVDYVALPLLATAGVVIGNARWGQPWPGWQEPTVLFVGMVGRPSSGKSPGLDAVSGPIAELEVTLNEDWDDRRRLYRRDCAEAKEQRAVWETQIKEAVKKRQPPPDMPADAEDPQPVARHRLFSTDPTTEKAVRLSHANTRGLLLIRDELSGWIGSMDRYSRGNGGDRAFWLQAYGGRPWTQDRIKDGDTEIVVPHLLWGICGGIQPDRVASQLLRGDDDGLAARFLFAWPAQIPPRRPSKVPDQAEAVAGLRRVRELPWQPPDPVYLPFTEEAAAVLQAEREEAAALEKSAAGMFQSWLGKLPGFCVRLAVILQHLDWCWRGVGHPPTQIEAWAVEKTADFLEQYAVPMAHRVFREAALPQAERHAHGLARWLAEQNPVPEVVNSRTLRRMTQGPGIPDAASMSAALSELAEFGWVRRSPARDGGPGRQRDDWTVNPAVKAVRQ
jgi:Protein of unknown function (DUF3987)